MPAQPDKVHDVLLVRGGVVTDLLAEAVPKRKAVSVQAHAVLNCILRDGDFVSIQEAGTYKLGDAKQTTKQRRLPKKDGRR